ncbi:MAG TPA: deoxyribose-phosphate aldolase [Lentisphaeria bacterium]|nr:MAG: deoxyribose-phosphate aldolase [Lentisphaerae bacterium GWF2_50_93]HCE44464.1 deoxyribose-phosphate aldolase [Lentisphaeria bacterium]
MKTSLFDLAKMIDHSLLHPTMTDADLKAGCELAMKYDVATVCIKPYAVPDAAKWLRNSKVAICAVAGFPHGNSHTEIIIAEAVRACEEGATEIDIVSNTGKVLGCDWDYVVRQIGAVNKAVIECGAILKVIFENDFLKDEHIIRLCEICSGLDVAFVKTSTGYGFVKQENGMYSYAGATVPHLKLMRKHSKPSVQIKAAGGVRSLDDLLLVRSIGVTRVGATATASILEEAKRRIDAGEDLSKSVNQELVTGGY